MFLLAFSLNDSRCFAGPTNATYLSCIDGFNLKISFKYSQTRVRVYQNKCGADGGKFQLEVGTTATQLRGCNQPFRAGRGIPMHGLNRAEESDLCFLGCIGGVDDEINILIILLPMKVE